MLDFIGKAIGSGLDYMLGRERMDQASAQALQNEQNQLKFAKNAIQWKVNDARKAGIHPLYALGAPTMSFSPVSLGDTSSSTDFAKTFGSMGSDLATALGAGMPKSGKVAAANETAVELQLEGMKLDNDIKRAKLASDVAKVTQPGVGSIPESGGFVVPEAKKAEDRPGIMFGGNRVS